MRKTPLTKFLETSTQVALARRVGVTQGLISSMVKRRRQIWVVEHDDGTLTLEEVKLIAREIPQVDSAA